MIGQANDPTLAPAPHGPTVAYVATWARHLGTSWPFIITVTMALAYGVIQWAGSLDPAWLDANPNVHAYVNWAIAVCSLLVKIGQVASAIHFPPEKRDG